MKKENIIAARDEMLEALTLANAVLAEDSQNPGALFHGTRLTGALRRKSMELSRALTDMRKA